MTERPFPYKKSIENAQLQALKDDGPLFSDELPKGSNFTSESRKYVGSLKPPWTGKSLWYLWGDERRAVRRFIEKYESSVREEMEKEKNSTLASRLDDAIWRLFCEEWYWGEYEDGEVFGDDDE